MHRNRRCKQCFASNAMVSNFDNNLMETACNNVSNANYIQDNDCMCGFDEEENLFPSNPMFGQSYVPWQTMDQTFIPCVGLKMGTIFPELVSPYMPGDSMRFNDFVESTNTIGKGCNK